MPLVESERRKLHYQVTGEGEPIVIIKGVLFSIKHWLGFEARLGRHYQVISIDNRGISGSSGPVSWNLSVYDMADDIKSVLGHINIPNAHILGVSLGGMVALAMGLKHPKLCRSLQLINTSIGASFLPRISPKAAVKLIKSGGFNQATYKVLGEVLFGNAISEKKRQTTVKSWQKIQNEDGWHRLTTIKQLIAASKFRPRETLKDLVTPTHIIYGTEDQFVPPINSFHLFNQIPNAKLTRMRNAGHEVSVDNPDQLISEINSFTKTLDN